ncbi:hypothetical protein JDS81_21580 [Bacillus cereus group sp. N31]|uniref:hypothetical protein n=1 Tax=Bacillus cereus group TaxID=86661 RepID=UPI0011556487|nr:MULTISPECIES: hypothetical protein [Bacillus cereus group]MBJ7931857.1 hypothetical protein [Bacillus cereus group sp. N31]
MRNIISIAIGSLSSILGILVSILILSINITEKTISEQMKNTILGYKPLSYYFQVSISTLLIMISANFLLNETVSNLAINITLYGTLFYIISILICGRSSMDDHGVPIVERHPIEELSITQNNSPDNIMILFPDHHRIVHKAVEEFNRRKRIVVYGNGRIDKLTLNNHLINTKGELERP